jgi:hypothetical protein
MRSFEPSGLSGATCRGARRSQRFDIRQTVIDV